MSDSEHVPLRQFIERILEERQEALRVTAESLEKRLSMLNELRGDVLTRSEYNPAHNNLIERMNRIERWQSKSVGIGITLVALSGIMGVLLGGAMAHYWK